jgi:hypothetical protein
MRIQLLEYHVEPSQEVIWLSHEMGSKRGSAQGVRD